MNSENRRGEHTLREIRAQAAAWEDTFRRIEAAAPGLKEAVGEAEEIVFAGCGSAFNISHAVAPFAQAALGRTCRAVQSSDLALNPGMFLNPRRRTLAVVYSRSGDTTESVLALRTARAAGCRTVAITCFPASAMAREASLPIALEGASEKSVTTTRSLTSMVLAGSYLAALCAGDAGKVRQLQELPRLATGMMERFERTGREIAENPSIRKYAFVGSGTLYGLAREAQLKIKEMVLLPADSYVSLDYQHGPMSNVDRGMLVTILQSDAGRAWDFELLRNMKALGGVTLLLCDRDRDGYREYADYLVEMESGLGDGLRDVLYMPTLQFMAWYKSMAAGCDPDRPRNLSYFVRVEAPRGGCG